MTADSQFRILYREFLFRIVDLEILSARADVAKLLGQFAAMLAALSLMFSNGALRLLKISPTNPAGAWVDEHFLIATTMAVVGLFAVLTWDSVLPNLRDVYVLSPLPLERRTIFFAKLAAVGAALALTVVALNVVSGLSYPLAIGQIIGGFFGFVRAFVAYWLTMLAAGAFVFGLILGIQGAAALMLSRHRFLRVSAFMQMATFCSVLAIYCLRPSLVTPASLMDPANRWVTEWLPSYWFLGLFQQLNGTSHDLLATQTTRAWLGLGAACVCALGVFLLSYFRQMRKIVEDPDVKPTRGARSLRFPTRIPGSALETAIVEFCARTLIRSRQHRIVLACYLGIGAAIALTFARSAFYGPQGLLGYAWAEVNRPLLIATVVMLCFSIVGVRVAFTLPTSLRANWLFQTVAIRPPADYLQATRRTLVILAVAPVVGFSLAVLLVLWPVWPVLGHVLLLSLLGLILTDLSLLRFKKIPFTCSYLPGKTQIHVTAAAGILVMMGLADAGVSIEIYALESVLRFLLLLAPLALVAALIHRRASENRTTSSLTFEQAPDSAVLTLDLQR